MILFNILSVVVVFLEMLCFARSGFDERCVGDAKLPDIILPDKGLSVDSLCCIMLPDSGLLLLSPPLATFRNVGERGNTCSSSIDSMTSGKLGSTTTLTIGVALLSAIFCVETSD